MKTHCSNCGKEINRKPCLFKTHKRFFCSPKCYSDSNKGKKLTKKHCEKLSEASRRRLKKGIVIECDYCGEKIYKYPCRLKKNLKHHFCGHKCHGLFYRGIRLNPDTEFKKGNIPPFKGKKGIHLSPETEFKKGIIPWNWKGKIRNGNGYILILKPEHPFCDKRGYVYKHRLVAEKCLERYLTKKEVIHHINGKKDDNRLRNLYLFATTNKHTKYHHSKNKSVLKSNLTELIEHIKIGE